MSRNSDHELVHPGHSISASASIFPYLGSFMSILYKILDMSNDNVVVNAV